MSINRFIALSLDNSSLIPFNILIIIVLLNLIFPSKILEIVISVVNVLMCKCCKKSADGQVTAVDSNDRAQN